MDAKFLSHVEALAPQLARLLAMKPVTPESLPSKMPQKVSIFYRWQINTFM